VNRKQAIDSAMQTLLDAEENRRKYAEKEARHTPDFVDDELKLKWVKDGGERAARELDKEAEKRKAQSRKLAEGNPPPYDDIRALNSQSKNFARAAKYIRAGLETWTLEEEVIE